MSGPKTVSVSVSPREIERQRARARERARRRARARERARQRARLQERARALSSRLNRLSERWRRAKREHGEMFSEWRHSEILRDLAECESDRRRDNDELGAVLDDLAGRVAIAESEYARQLAVSKLRTSLEAMLPSQAAHPGPETVPSEEDDEAQRSEREMRRGLEEVSGLLATLAAEVPDDARAAIEKRADEALASPLAFRRKALLSQLHLEIRRANRAAAARRRTVAEATGWREQLLGLEGPDIEELDRHLRRVVDGAAPAPGLAKRVEDAVARATEASERAYALGVITEELENLGYVVERGFETASARHPEALLRKPGMEDDYRVSLRAEGPLLHNRVVREDRDADPGGDGRRSPDRRRADREMERVWCSDLAAGLAAAEQRGVHGRVVSRMRPGEVPVHAVAALPGESGARSKSKRRRKRKRAGRLKSRSARPRS